MQARRRTSRVPPTLAPRSEALPGRISTRSMTESRHSPRSSMLFLILAIPAGTSPSSGSLNRTKQIICAGVLSSRSFSKKAPRKPVAPVRRMVSALLAAHILAPLGWMSWSRTESARKTEGNSA
ncbi:hypothetical protein KC367_g178 [Hortaea werneckii]|nr:hypothetical protein KC367_g178 [Hortaea werneckii]